ncbi:flavin reductase [Schaalia meyeri]|uniref:NADPH-dependent oxidoreductase n=1 Tax=Schaalia meyeri TaxID=52773 RepID=UPI000683281C|nr:NADPH-dependent oxidoreductase [Schaalia meyeri]AKU65592.1 flavin reductase [Schaalia meyeri]OFQ23576.1 NADPH-dependent oxidoreductase [Actinomyces sp. HMSC062G12]
MTNDTIALQLAHRTIRAYKEQPLTDAEVTTLMDVARHTATASYLQACTILHITDPQIREKITAASGQPYVGGTAGDLFIFLVDMYRNSRIRAEQGVSSEPLSSMNLFLAAAEDALLSAQNVVVAAESMGLGTVYLGSILADPRGVVEALQLPPLTFPILGMIVGHPDQEPGMKPRLPISVMSARNTYPRVESYTELLADYDREVTEYYDLRSGSRLESFTHLVGTTIGVGGAHVSPILEVLHEQGLCLR